MQNVIAKFGGTVALARAMGVTHSAISNWRARGVPASAKYRLLQLAKKRGVTLSIDDLEQPECAADVVLPSSPEAA